MKIKVNGYLYICDICKKVIKDNDNILNITISENPFKNKQIKLMVCRKCDNKILNNKINIKELKEAIK